VRAWWPLLATAIVVAAGCSRPLATARMSDAEPPAAVELEAAARLARPRCSRHLGLLFPGLAQACLRKDGEAALLGSLAAAEAVTAISVAQTTDESGHPGVALPLIALQDLWVYGLGAAEIDGALAQRRRFAPRDTLSDLAAAPFNAEVMRRPAVWGGLLGFLAVGIGASLLVDEDPDTSRAGDDPELFGHRMDRAVGYPLGFGAGVGLFTHVAIAEEVLFRGLAQSHLARTSGETEGWLAASLLFGLAHAPNALLLPEDQRRDYLLIGVPVITAGGAYLGWLYRDSDYGLASPVAVHFWYDLLLTTTFFVLDPESSPFQAAVALPF
jgi:membrane protease YdiL (CAAX protease family)